jgi:hypothetical protein
MEPTCVGPFSKVSALVLPTNVRLGQMCLTAKNALAYYTVVFITAVKVLW